MYQVKRVETVEELHGLLKLQKANHKISLSQEEIVADGFVTVNHSFEEISNLHRIEPSVITKFDDEVVSYVIAMTKDSQESIPVLIPMFDMFKTIPMRGKFVSDFNYMVVGQVCVAKQYRGQGVFKEAYDFYKECFRGKYDFAITEIATENTRSLKAHEKVGFKPIHQFIDKFGIDWQIVVWEW